MKPERLQLAPRWADAWTEQSTSGKSILIVPAREKRVQNKDLKIRRFFIFTTTDHSVSDGRIVEFVGMKYDVESNVRFLIKNFDRHSIAGFNGAIIQYDVNYRKPISLVYKDGVKINAQMKIATYSGLELKEIHDRQKAKIMATNASSDSCMPVYPQLVNFPPVIDECFYNYTEVWIYDADDCVIEHLYVYASHVCLGDDGDNGESSSSGSGSGSNDEGNPDYGEDPEPGPELPDNVPLRLSFCDGLSASDRASIDSVANVVSNLNCATKLINNRLNLELDLDLKVCIEDRVLQSGTYDPSTKIINFTTQWASTQSDVFRHEVFHAYQDNVAYSNGIGGYGTTVANPGFVNIEFEQAVFKDITEDPASPMALAHSSNALLQEEYSNWIQSLTSNGTAYPNLSTPQARAEFDTNFLKYLTEFNSSDPFYGNNAMKADLKPEALKRIFNGLVKGGCGN